MYTPDFLIKPYQVHSHPGLRPSDSDVYAVVYWFERMKDGKCTASNETIAEVACLKERTIGAALERLEREGFIERVYSDSNRTLRMEIKTLVHMTRTTEERTKKMPRMRRTKSVKIKDEDIKPGAIVKVDAPGTDPKDPTPGEVAKDFFAGKGETSLYRERIVDELTASTGATRDAIVTEAKKFYLYWTEPNKSGTKQKWQLQQTFDVKLRLITWLSRANVYNKTSKRAGAGVTI